MVGRGLLQEVKDTMDVREGPGAQSAITRADAFNYNFIPFINSDAQARPQHPHPAR